MPIFYSHNISVASVFREVLPNEAIIPSLAYDFEKQSNVLAPKCLVPIADHDGSNHNLVRQKDSRIKHLVNPVSGEGITVAIGSLGFNIDSNMSNIW